jgi:hypothetical protein
MQIELCVISSVKSMDPSLENKTGAKHRNNAAAAKAQPADVKG